MSDIADLEGRISSALDRIGRSVDAILAKPAPEPEVAPAPEPAPEPAPAPEAPSWPDDREELARVKAELNEERTANAQLEERVRVLKERMDVKIATMKDNGEAMRAELQTLTTECTRLQDNAQKLTENNDLLREANMQGLADPHLINKSLLNELEVLRAARAAEAAEINALLADLKPLVGKANDA